MNTKILKCITNNKLIKAKTNKISTKKTINITFNKLKINKKYKKSYYKKIKKIIHCECTFIEKDNLIEIKNLNHFSKKKTFKMIKIIK